MNHNFVLCVKATTESNAYFSVVLLLMLFMQMLVTESRCGESTSFPNYLSVTRYHFGIYLHPVTAMETLWNFFNRHRKAQVYIFSLRLKTHFLFLLIKSSKKLQCLKVLLHGTISFSFRKSRTVRTERCQLIYSL